MENVNLIFFEEYKTLNNVCGQMYSDNRGVTKYIEDMECTSWMISKKIHGWDDTLRQLRRMRHIRNKLAHETSFDVIICTHEDVEWIHEFYESILDARDPIALCYKMLNTKSQVNEKVMSKENFDTGVSLNMEIVDADDCQEEENDCNSFGKRLIIGFLILVLVGVFLVGVGAMVMALMTLA